MKLGDLEAIFEKAWDAAFEAEFAAGGFQENADTYRRCDRAGIRAIVTTLRDEMFSDANDALDIYNMFNEIIGDAGNEKAEGGPNRKADTDDRTVTASSAEPIPPGPLFVERTPELEAVLRDAPETFCDCKIEMASFRDPGTMCPHCQRLIGWPA